MGYAAGIVLYEPDIKRLKEVNYMMLTNVI